MVAGPAMQCAGNAQDRRVARPPLGELVSEGPDATDQRLAGAGSPQRRRERARGAERTQVCVSCERGPMQYPSFWKALTWRCRCQKMLCGLSTKR